MANSKPLRQIAAQQANAAKQQPVKRPEDMDEQVVPAEGAEASAQPVAEAPPVAETSGGSSGSGPSYGLVGAGALGALGLIAAVAGGGGGGKSGGTTPPVAEIPKPDQPKPQEPKPEEPKPVEPKPEGPKTEQPQPVETKPEEPKTEQPQPKLPKPEDQGQKAFPIKTLSAALSEDSGQSNSDRFTKYASLTVDGLSEGSLLWFSTDGGNNWRATSGRRIYDSEFSGDGPKKVLLAEKGPADEILGTGEFEFVLDRTAPKSPGIHFFTHYLDQVRSSYEEKIEFSLEEGARWSLADEVFNFQEGGPNDAVGKVKGPIFYFSQTDVAGNTAEWKVANRIAVGVDEGAATLTKDSKLFVIGVYGNAIGEYSLDGGNSWMAVGNEILGSSFSGPAGQKSVHVRYTDGNVTSEVQYDFKWAGDPVVATSSAIDPLTLHLAAPPVL
ncbi:hypothetical protein [Roseateles sp.]|uniref:hypothetical protein n=1 Tax=Roseateles sp. TaxID=1971397 RepID=UPI0031D30421